MTQTNTPQRARKGAPPPSSRRISTRIRQAIRERVENGKSIAEACRIAGIAQSTWFKAMTQPHVVAYVEATKGRFVSEIDRLKAAHKAQAIEVGLELLYKAKSEAVRARMVEFFAGERVVAPVQVNINNEAKSGVYAYPKPGQRIVTIEGEAEEPDPTST